VATFRTPVPDREAPDMPSTATIEWLELARRAGNGVEVALLWNPAGNSVKVVVSDPRLCHHVDLDVGGPDALIAFRERFADAAPALLQTPRNERAAS
jgi:hypothetical protein